MPTTIRMPQLGETVTEGTVARWLKQPGDTVAKYEAFVEVSTDKVNAEVPSPVSGTILRLIVAEGETVPTGAAIAEIEHAGAESPPASGAPEAPSVVAPPPGLFTAPAATRNGNGNGAGGSNGTRVSPAVRRLAREHAVDVAALHGTGSHGRVTAADVVAAANGRAGTATAVAAFEPPAPVVPQREPRRESTPTAGELLTLTPARRLIARRMVESKHTAPHAWTMTEVDVSKLWAWRQAAKAAFEREHGTKLTLLPFFMHAVVAALRAFPLMNASFTDDGIAVHKSVHLGIATAADESLVVPVVRNAEERSIQGLALASAVLIDKARRGRLAADDLAGGTFTVNNIGATGSILSAPILVPGQAGIVTMEAVVKRPVVIDDAIAIRSMMNVCLSLDHRVVDGAIAGGFLADLKRRLEAMGPTGSL